MRAWRSIARIAHGSASHLYYVVVTSKEKDNSRASRGQKDNSEGRTRTGKRAEQDRVL